MPSQEWTLMGKLVSQMFSKSEAEPFREPVDWKTLGLFDYPQIIKKPMDLGQIKRRIEKKEYSTLNDAAEDVRLVWKNCMQYNADASDFYKLAQSLSKKFEDKYSKLVKELNIVPPDARKAAAEPTIEEKRLFAKNLYKITKEELGKVIIDLDKASPESITKNAAEDQVEINVDDISPEAFQTAFAYVTKCIADGPSRKKKSSSGGSSKVKKARTS
mmetsp:Transcript_3893/g.5087  ORF Transcript_3893/g.5087 Transcript_3893/m.5087 type:complete len:216 (-) Transcript_3893:41-688(-)